MRALSIMQPWAHLILQGCKDVENRTWSTDVRGPVLIHAGKRMDKDAYENFKEKFNLPDELPLGGIVGAVEISDCLSSIECRSPWNSNAGYCFVMTRPVVLPFREWKGQLKFFDVSMSMAATEKVIELMGENP